MKFILTVFLVFIGFKIGAQEIEFELPPMPPVYSWDSSLPCDEFFKHHQGVTLHPKIENEIEILPCVIYHINRLITALSPSNKYCLLTLNVLIPDERGIMKTKTFVIRDKKDNKDWEELEIFEATPEIIGLFQDQIFNSSIYFGNDNIIKNEK